MIIMTTKSSAGVIYGLFLLLTLPTTSAVQSINNKPSSTNHEVVSSSASSSSFSYQAARDLKEDETVPDDVHESSHRRRRVTIRARTTLLNLNLQPQEEEGKQGGLSPSELVFLEDSWKAAYNEVHRDDRNDQEDMQVRSVILERQDYPPAPPIHRQRQLLRGGKRHIVMEKDDAEIQVGEPTKDHQHHDNNRALGDGRTTTSRPTNIISSMTTVVEEDRRSLYYYSKTYVDLWMTVELTCFLCDPDYRHLEQQQQQQQQEKQGHNGEHEERNSIHRQMEWNFCRRLLTGPFDTFLGVDDCRIAYVAK